MQNLTIGQIATGLAFIVGLWVSVETMSKKINTHIDSLFEKKIKPIETKIDKMDKNTTMNFLVRCFGDLDKGEKLDDATTMRMYEQYDYYVNTLHGNTYIHSTFERLKKEGKL